MIRSIFIVCSLALLAACTQPEQAVTPTPPVAEQPKPLPTQNVVLTDPGLLVKVTEYRVGTNGTKTVKLNGQDVSLVFGAEHTFTYDSQKRLTQHRKSFGDQWTSIDIQYGQNRAEVRERQSNGRESVGQWALNDKSLIVGAENPNEYVYDANDYMIGYDGNGQKVTRTVKDGDFTKEIVVYKTLTQTSIYTYDTTKPAVPLPQRYRGRHSQHLLVKQASSDELSASYFQFFYDFDEKGRAIREFTVRDDKRIESVREFVYQ